MLELCLQAPSHAITLCTAQYTTVQACNGVMQPTDTGLQTPNTGTNGHHPHPFPLDKIVIKILIPFHTLFISCTIFIHYSCYKYNIYSFSWYEKFVKLFSCIDNFVFTLSSKLRLQIGTKMYYVDCMNMTFRYQNDTFLTYVYFTSNTFNSS